MMPRLHGFANAPLLGFAPGAERAHTRIVRACACHPQGSSFRGDASASLSAVVFLLHRCKPRRSLEPPRERTLLKRSLAFEESSHIPLHSGNPSGCLMRAHTSMLASRRHNSMPVGSMLGRSLGGQRCNLVVGSPFRLPGRLRPQDVMRGCPGDALLLLAFRASTLADQRPSLAFGGGWTQLVCACLQIVRVHLGSAGR